MGSGDFKFIYDDLYSKDPTVANRYNGLKPQFDYGDMEGILSKIYDQQRQGITRTAGNAVQRNQKDAASRLAAEGISGGSVYNNQINKATDNTNQTFANLLEGLDTSRLGQELPLMNSANQTQLQITQGAQNTDLANVSNMLQRYGLLSNIAGSKANAETQENQQPGFLEDLFSGLGQIGQLAAIPTGFGAAGGVTSNLLSSIFGKEEKGKP